MYTIVPGTHTSIWVEIPERCSVEISLGRFINTNSSRCARAVAPKSSASCMHTLLHSSRRIRFDTLRWRESVGHETATRSCANPSRVPKVVTSLASTSLLRVRFPRPSFGNLVWGSTFECYGMDHTISSCHSPRTLSHSPWRRVLARLHLFEIWYLTYMRLLSMEYVYTRTLRSAGNTKGQLQFVRFDQNKSIVGLHSRV